MAGRDLATFVFPLWLYLSLSVYQLTLPGLAYDEVFFGPAALGQTQDFRAPLPATLEESGGFADIADITNDMANPAARFSPLRFTTFLVRLGDISFPVMLMPYWGAIKSLLLAPWFALAEVSVELIRLVAIGIGALALVCILVVLRSFFSPLVALLAGLFLATDPSYLFYTRHDFGGAALSLLLMFAPLVCLIGWWTQRSLRYWAATFFLFGFGVYHRLDFLAFLAALGGVGGLCLRRTLWEQLNWQTGSVAAVAFCLGLGPFLMFVWQRPTIAASPLSLVRPMTGSVEEALGEALGLLRLKSYVIGTVLNGTALYDFFFDRSGLSVGRVVCPNGEKRVGVFTPDQSLRLASLLTGTLTPAVLLVALCSVWFMCPPHALRALLIFLLLFMVCLFLVRGAVRGHHFVVLVPAVAACLASAGQHFFRQLRHSWARVGMLAVGIGCIGTNLIVDYRYHQLLSATGGRGIWSDAIYDVTTYLQQSCPTRRCLLGDWGMGTQALTLASGQLAIEEMFWPYLNSDADKPARQHRQEQQLLQLMLSNQPNQIGPTRSPLFVFYTDRYVNFSRPKQLLYATANKAGLEVTVERVFDQRDGTPVIEVVSLQAGQAGHGSSGRVLD